jgi:two-component system cell cycle sensor histidine kinase/response regulator CckA
MMSQTALLVDDEKAIRDYVAMILKQEGFRIFEADDGMDALALLRTIRGMVDVLVTDVSMPRMTGIELANAVTMEFPAIPVIYVSGLGFGLRDELHNPRRRTAFVRKPFTPKVMRDAVRQVIAGDAAGSAAG